jgi:hypothetical protein
LISYENKKGNYRRRFVLSDKSSVREDAQEGGWHFVDYDKGKCYCEDCHIFNDNDELVLKKPKP